MDPLVSVVINCFNQAKYLKRAIDSVTSQSYKNIEIVIVDDGSTDNTKQVAQNIKKQVENLEYVHTDNKGLPSARNLGLKHCKGDWIQFLDADDWLHPEKFTSQLEGQTESKEDVILYGNYCRVTFDKADKEVSRTDNIVGEKNTAQLIERMLTPDFLCNTPHPLLQQAMLINKNVFPKVKFPPELLANGDRFFGIDALMNNCIFVHTPTIGAFYSKHSGNRTNSMVYMKDFYVLFYEKCYQKFPALKNQTQIGIQHFLNESLKRKDWNTFRRLVPFIEKPQNIKTSLLSFSTKSATLLKLAYLVRILLPGKLLYDSLRGPRSKKLFSLLKGAK